MEGSNKTASLTHWIALWSFVRKCRGEGVKTEFSIRKKYAELIFTIWSYLLTSFFNMAKQKATRLHFRNCSTSTKKSWQKNHYFSPSYGIIPILKLNTCMLQSSGLSKHQKVTKLISWTLSQNIVITSQKARLNNHLSASYCNVFLGIHIWGMNCAFIVKKIIPL